MDNRGPSLKIFHWATIALACGVFSYASSVIGEQAGQDSNAASAPRIRLEATLIEFGVGAIKETERAVGFKLSTEEEQLVITQQQKEELLAAIEENAAARVVATSAAEAASGQRVRIHLEGNLRESMESAFPTIDAGADLSIGGIVTEPNFQFRWRARDQKDWLHLLSTPNVTTIGGQRAQIDVVQEITYPTEYDRETTDIGGSPGGQIESFSGEHFMVIRPGQHKRKVAASVSVTPSIMRDGRIAILASLQVSVLSGWKMTEESNVPRPTFRTWHKTTSLLMPDGSSFILKESPPDAVSLPEFPDPEAVDTERIAIPQKPRPENQETLPKGYVPPEPLETEVLRFVRGERGGKPPRPWRGRRAGAGSLLSSKGRRVCPQNRCFLAPGQQRDVQ